MLRNLILNITLVLLGVGIGERAHVAEAAVVTQAPAVSNQILMQLRSSDPQERQRGFYGLKRIPGALAAADNLNVLVDLLERENKYADSLLRAHPDQGIGEGYGEYYLELLDSFSPLRGKLDRRAVEALAVAHYDQSGGMAVYLATKYGEQILPFIFGKAKDDNLIIRYEAMQMLTTISLHTPRLSQTTVNSIRAAVRTGVVDKEVPVRQAAIEGLGQIGDATDLPLLQERARSDPAMYNAKPGDDRFPVRSEAQKAIDAIQKRTGH